MKGMEKRYTEPDAMLRLALLESQLAALFDVSSVLSRSLDLRESLC